MTGAEFSGVDIDLLADYIGGALAGTPDESAVAALIADDPAWQTAYESLSSGMALVGAALARLEPEPMPADLAARLEVMFTTPIADPAPIDAELASPSVPHLALVRGDDASEDGPDPVPERPDAVPERPDPVPQRAARPRPGRRRRWVAPIAVAAGLIAFVGFGLDYLAGRDGRSDTNSTAAGSSGEKDSAAMAAPSASEVGQILTTGTDYTSATLATEPVKPMTAPEPGASAQLRERTPSALAGSNAALGRLMDRGALLGCLSAIERENAGGALSVQSVDYARFNGSPAVVVRFTAKNGRWAWASGPACGTPAAGADRLDKVPVG